MSDKILGFLDLALKVQHRSLEMISLSLAHKIQNLSPN